MDFKAGMTIFAARILLTASNLYTKIDLGRDEEQLGYVYLETHQDYFTGNQIGHISTIAVSERGEGQGVGGALMRAAEESVRSKGFRRLTLNVFEANGRAREIYEHLGFRVETLHYIKPFD